jgi:hypothetical protein
VIDVNVHYPFDPNMSELERKGLEFPHALCGYADRVLAQLAFNGWLASNPETAKRLAPASNPPHWSDT